MLSIQNAAGRLVEIRAGAPLEGDDVERFKRKLADFLDSSAVPMVVCADIAGLRILPPNLAQELVWVMRHDNPRIERSAILLPGDRAALELQFDRLLEEAANPNRRCFQDAGDLERWLGVVLSKPECIRLGRFLAGAMAA